MSPQVAAEIVALVDEFSPGSFMERRGYAVRSGVRQCLGFVPEPAPDTHEDER